MSNPRRLFLFVLALTLTAALPAVASAATLTRDGTTLTFTAAPDIANDLELDEPEAGTLTIETSEDPIAALPTGCTDTDGDTDPPASSVSCTGVEVFVANTLDEDDQVAAGADGDSFVDTIQIEFYAGEDDDSSFGGGDDDTIVGGPGNDSNLRGGLGDDTVSGGEGDDDVTGGPGDDTVDGDGGNDDVTGGPGTDLMTGGDGDDDMEGCNGGCSDDPEDFRFDGGDTMDGGAGDDNIDGREGDDIITGGTGEDNLRGQSGDDIVDGGEGNESDVVGGPGEDVVNGGPGDDVDVYGGPGDDDVTGGDGNDEVSGGCFGACNRPDGPDGTDVVRGGAGIDRLIYTGYYEDPDTEDDVSAPHSITLDGVANDGRAGESDNVLEIEDIELDGSDQALTTSTVVADGFGNVIETDENADTIDPAGGNDFVASGDGNDTINAVDGFADRINCGEGIDTANVDQFDTVASCETVNRSQVGNATDDAPPTVAFTNPAENGGSLKNGTVLRATASDNQQVTQVVFLAGSRVLCTDTTAPYECTYSKADDDVGKATLIAIAFDNLQQTAQDLRFMNVSRFKPRLTSKVTPRSDTSDPRTFRVSGRLRFPAGVADSEGCDGKVLVRFKAGKKTISSKRARVRNSCRYSVRRTFTLPRRFAGASSLRVFARFVGNDVLRPDAARVRRVTVG